MNKVKKIVSILSIISVVVFFGPTPHAFAVDTITLRASAQQQVPPVAFTAVTGGSSNYALIVMAICSGGNKTTAVTYAGAAMTKMVTEDNSLADPGTETTLWIKVNPATGSNNIATTCAGTSRVSYVSFSGVDQTTGYNSGATNTCDSGSAAAQACGVTTGFSGSILVGGLISPTQCTSLAVQANTLKWATCGTQNYLGIYSSAAITPAGAADLGYTTAMAGTFAVAEIIANGASGGGATFNPWQFWDF